MSEFYKEIRICFLGESFVNGTGDPEFLGWTGRVCAKSQRKGYEITYYNLGVCAETSTYLKQRWKQESDRLLASIPYFLPVLLLIEEAHAKKFIKLFEKLNISVSY